MTMRPIIAIRTHQWTEEEERLFALLRDVPGHDLVVVFHNRPDGLKLPLDVIDINDDWLTEHRLSPVRDWGWRCGDYFYYALRLARPDYTHYWLVEPDLYFSGEPGGFFGRFEAVTTDALGYGLKRMEGRTPYTRGLTGVAHHKALFPLTRLSGDALDRLLPRRQEYSDVPRAPRFFTNEEVFVFSHAVADGDLTTGRLEDVAPEWFEGVRFAPSPDMLAEVLDEKSLPEGRIFHPVRARAAFKNAIATRLAGSHFFFLNNVLEALALMSQEELEEMAEAAGQKILTQLEYVHQRSLRAARRRDRQASQVSK